MMENQMEKKLKMTWKLGLWGILEGFGLNMSSSLKSSKGVI